MGANLLKKPIGKLSILMVKTLLNLLLLSFLFPLPTFAQQEVDVDEEWKKKVEILISRPVREAVEVSSAASSCPTSEASKIAAQGGRPLHELLVTPDLILEFHCHCHTLSGRCP